MQKHLIALSSLVLIIGGCAYDNYEDLHPKESVLKPGSSSCDTTVAMKYSTDIKPIIISKCGTDNNSCHGSAPASGLNYTSYQDLGSVAKSGALLGTITHNPNYTPMPKGGVKLDDCSIGKIKKWIAAGALNN